jgi:hypothetical protein
MIRVAHFFDNNTKTEDKLVKYPAFLLTNKKGGYCYLCDRPLSRYQGFFILDNWKLFKILEDIRPVRADSIKSVTNNFWNAERAREEMLETFFYPDFFNTLVYELDDRKNIELVFDVKETYDNREFGRYYQIEEHNDVIVVTFTKRTDRKEDPVHDQQEYQVFIAIKPDILDYSLTEKWEKKNYPLDKARNSMPFERYVYRGLQINAKKMIISAGMDREKVISEVHYIFDNIEKLKIKENLEIRNRIKIASAGNIRVAFVCAQYALNNLVTTVDKIKGIFAGMPWFFQFWSRDELISLNALIITGHYALVKEILNRHLDAVNEYGRLPNIFSPYAGTPLGSADSIGWLFKRIHDFLEALRVDESLEKYYTHEELAAMIKKLQYALDRINKNFVKDGLYHNASLETWMDTQYENDTREGFRIEIQALYINMYRVLYYLTQDPSYKEKENSLCALVKQKFWNNGYLYDGVDDPAIRPNIFLAAYIYPDLLTQDEWKECFSTIFDKLWLPWGGFTTIDRTSPLFCSKSTGENVKSYHRGDSWFYLNNCAALVLYRIDKELFKKYILKILEASSSEILFKGIIGTHAELSSAESLKSQPTLSQAWSNALFIELVHELFG